MCYAFVPVTIGDLGLNAALIDRVKRDYNDDQVSIWLTGYDEPYCLEGPEADAFWRWWNIRADMIIGGDNAE